MPVRGAINAHTLQTQIFRGIARTSGCDESARGVVGPSAGIAYIADVVERAGFCQSASCS